MHCWLISCLYIQCMCYVHVLLRYIYCMRIKNVFFFINTDHLSYWFFARMGILTFFGTSWTMRSLEPLFVKQIFYIISFTFHVGKYLTDLILSNLFSVWQYIHNQYVILCIKKIYSHSIFSDWLYLFLFVLVISSHFSLRRRL